MPKLIIVSGISLGLTSALTRELRGALEELLPGKVAYVGNPFRGRPHPLVWEPETNDLHSCIRLTRSWERLIPHLNETAGVLATGKHALGQHLGLSALVYAISRMPEWVPTENDKERIEKENTQAECLHHGGFVHAIVKALGIELPHYLIPCAEPEFVTKDLIRRTPALGEEVEPDMLAAYVRYEKAAMLRYFDKKYGQNAPRWIDAALPMPQMLEQALEHIADILGEEQSEQAVA